MGITPAANTASARSNAAFFSLRMAIPKAKESFGDAEMAIIDASARPIPTQRRYRNDGHHTGREHGLGPLQCRLLLAAHGHP
jgi:hypothetical protein